MRYVTHYLNRHFNESEKMDRYYRDKFGVFLKYDEYDNYGNENKYDIVAKVTGVPIIKNPRSLEDFDSGVRAIIDKSGNLFVALKDGSFNHGMMANALIKTGQIKSTMYNEKAPPVNVLSGIYADQKKFILMNRLYNKDIFFQSDSLIWEGKHTEAILNKLKDRFPQYKFYIKHGYDE